MNQIRPLTLFYSSIFVLILAFTLNAQSTQERLKMARDFYLKGVEQARRGNLDAAIEFYSSALKLDSGNYEAYNNRGVTYLRKNEFDLAIMDFSAAVSLQPASIGAILNLSHAYYRKGQFERALEFVDRAFEINANSPQAWSTRGLIHRRQKEYQKAIGDYTKAIEIKPDSSYFSGRCLTYYDFGKFENAVSDCSEAVSLNSSDSMSYYFRALARIKLGQIALAITDLRKATLINPDFKEAKEKLELLLKDHKY